jgi:hypothetical protein
LTELPAIALEDVLHLRFLHFFDNWSKCWKSCQSRRSAHKTLGLFHMPEMQHILSERLLPKRLNRQFHCANLLGDRFFFDLRGL